MYKFLEWGYEKNIEAVNLVLFSVIANIISLVNFNLVTLCAYSISWYNINSKIYGLSKNNIYTDYWVSLLHSVGLIIMMILNTFINSTFIKNNILIYTMSYFFYDMFIIVNHKYSKLFLYHHILSILTLIIAFFNEEYLDRILFILLLGEISNPCQNTYNILKIRKHEYTDTVFKYFTIFFCFLRIFVFPIYWYSSGLLFENNKYSNIINFNLLLGTITSGFWIFKMCSIYRKKFLS